MKREAKVWRQRPLSLVVHFCLSWTWAKGSEVPWITPRARGGDSVIAQLWKQQDCQERSRARVQHPSHHQKRHRASVHPSIMPDPWERGEQISTLSLPSLDTPKTTGLGLRISLWDSILSTLRGEREKEERTLVIEERGNIQIMRKPSLTPSAHPQQLSLAFWSTSSVFHSCSLISAPSPEKIHIFKEKKKDTTASSSIQL